MQLIAPAAVLDFSAQVAENADFLVEVDHIKTWEAEHGALPEGGWLICRTGWDARSSDQDSFLNADDTGPHTPGFSTECAQWLASEAPIIGVGVETVGTDAGAAHSFEPAFPCHRFLLGAGKYGLTQLQNVAKLPPTGALILTAPLPIVGGSGSPTRALPSWKGPRERCRSGWTHTRGPRRRPRVRRRGQRQLPRHQRPRGRGRPLRRGPARERSGRHGRRLRAQCRPLPVA